MIDSDRHDQDKLRLTYITAKATSLERTVVCLHWITTKDHRHFFFTFVNKSLQFEWALTGRLGPNSTNLAAKQNTLASKIQSYPLHTVKLWLLFLCSYLCLYLLEIFCVKGLFLSARMYVLAFQYQHTLLKRNILSNYSLVYEQRENISLWGGCVGPGRPIHTYEQREQDLWHRIFLANTDIDMSKERETVDFIPFNCKEDRGRSSLAKLVLLHCF